MCGVTTGQQFFVQVSGGTGTCELKYSSTTWTDLIATNQCTHFLAFFQGTAIAYPEGHIEFSANTASHGVLASRGKMLANSAVYVPMSGPRSAYTNVNQLAVKIDLTAPTFFQAFFEHICCVPSVACRHSFSNLNPNIGDTVIFSFTCEYFTAMDTLDMVPTVLSLDVERFGEFNGNSLCSGSANVGPFMLRQGDTIGTFINHTPTGSFPDFHCTSEIVVTKAGTFSDVAAEVAYDAANDLYARTIESTTPLVNNAQFCTPAASTLTVTDPNNNTPPTMAPTRPPTTKPPTTLPPTTLPPTTLPPTQPPTEAPVDAQQPSNECSHCNWGAGCFRLPFPGSWFLPFPCVVVPSNLHVSTLRGPNSNTCYLVEDGASVQRIETRLGNDCIVIQPGGSVGAIETATGTDYVCTGDPSTCVPHS